MLEVLVIHICSQEEENPYYNLVAENIERERSAKVSR